MRFEGIFSPVITPFRKDDSVDYNAYQSLIEHLLDSGVHGLVIGGTTGEYYVESLDERVKLLELAIQQNSGRATLVFGTGSVNPRESIALAEAGARAGADSILVATPPYALPTQRELACHALAVERAANLPVMLYNYPDRMGVNMDAEFLDRVGHSSNFQAIKESSGNINRVHMLSRDYPHIQLSCGMDDQALEFFAWGARSWVCAGSNFLPKEHIALYNACVLEGDFGKGRRIMSAMLPLMRVLEQGGKFIQCVKHGVTLAGHFSGAVRKPLRGLNKNEKRQLEQVIRVLKTTVASIETSDPAIDADAHKTPAITTCSAPAAATANGG